MVGQQGIFIGVGMMEDVALQVKTTVAQVNRLVEVLNSYDVMVVDQFHANYST